MATKLRCIKRSVDSCIVGIELNKNLIQLREAILHFKVKFDEFMPQKTIWALKSVTERANALVTLFSIIYNIFLCGDDRDRRRQIRSNFDRKSRGLNSDRKYGHRYVNLSLPLSTSIETIVIGES